MTEGEWQRVIACDLTSVFLVSRAAVRLMLARGSGRIINIASIAGKEGNPTLVPYSTAKAGVIGFTKALAKEVATRGILVNAAALVAWLASDECSFSTGAVYDLSGGRATY